MKKMEKLLILRKTSKLDYLINKYGNDIVKKSPEFPTLLQSKNIQDANSNEFIEAMLKACNMNQSIKIITDSFLNNNDVENLINIETYDQVFSLGGDGTFLRSAGLVNKGDPLFIGVNTDLKRSVGYYCSISLCSNLKKKVKQILNKEYKERSISKIRVDFPQRNKTIYFINDMYFGENFKGRVSKYSLFLDRKDLSSIITSKLWQSNTKDSEDIINYINNIQTSGNQQLYNDENNNIIDPEFIENQFKSSGAIFSTCKLS
jgi:NAD kinase